MSTHPEVYLIGFILLCATVLVIRITDAAKSKTEDVSHYLYETRKGFLAAAILIGLGALLLCSMVFYYFAPDAKAQQGKDIFDACKMIVPPLIALIIGYFFGRGNPEKLEGRREEKKDSE